MPLDFLNRSIINSGPTLQGMVICTIASLVFGLAIAGIYVFRNKYSKSLASTLVLLPAIVQVIIMLVNGNIGIGIAVAGAFSLIRFRSIPGTAREIGSLFFAMAIGFVTGLGYIFYAFVFLLIIGGVSLLLTRFSFGENGNIRYLKIKIPENLDYEGLFDEIFPKYTSSAELEKVKTVNLGSLFELTYAVRLKTSCLPKKFIDELRSRNGNLTIMLSRDINREEL
ncbi:MAG: DUF4956 domain-containing protein [Treponema sp.]|nr:DUF4956 domain-containing protein [Treponema sp.]